MVNFCHTCYFTFYSFYLRYSQKILSRQWGNTCIFSFYSSKGVRLLPVPFSVVRHLGGSCCCFFAVTNNLMMDIFEFFVFLSEKLLRRIFKVFKCLLPNWPHGATFDFNREFSRSPTNHPSVHRSVRPSSHPFICGTAEYVLRKISSMCLFP